jgi:hypothetical protein
MAARRCSSFRSGPEARAVAQQQPQTVRRSQDEPAAAGKRGKRKVCSSRAIYLAVEFRPRRAEARNTGRGRRGNRRWGSRAQGCWCRYRGSPSRHDAGRECSLDWQRGACCEPRRQLPRWQRSHERRLSARGCPAQVPTLVRDRRAGRGKSAQPAPILARGLEGRKLLARFAPGYAERDYVTNFAGFSANSQAKICQWQARPITPNNYRRP